MRKGSHHTPETLVKLSVANMGHHPSEETRAKISIAGLGKKRTDETRARLSASKVGEKNPRWGKHFPPPSDATRVKQRIAKMGHPVSAETRKKISEKNIARYLKRPQPAGNKSPFWKGGKSKSGGYDVICIHPNLYLSVHRQNMERTLGRKLQKGEIVHHVNITKTDNRETNLALCSDRAAHLWAHREEAKVFFG